MVLSANFWPSPLKVASPEPVVDGATPPRTFRDFVRQISAWDQFYLTVLSIIVAAVGTLPIEMQRRMVNAAVTRQGFHTIATLAATYLAIVTLQGLFKLVTNIYRAWVGTNAVRLLRRTISAITYRESSSTAGHQGTKISMIIMEADAVGSFVGDVVAEPVLDISLLIFVFGYLIYLQPIMALVSATIFTFQATFVPAVQRAINRRIEARIAILREAGSDVIEQDEELGKFYLNRFTRVFQLDMGIFDLKYALNFLMNLTQHAGTVGIIVLGGWFILKGEIQVGTVVAFLSSLASVIDPWGDVVAWYQNYMVAQTKYGLIGSAMISLSTEVDRFGAN